MRKKYAPEHVMNRDGVYYYVRHIPYDLSDYYNVNLKALHSTLTLNPPSSCLLLPPTQKSLGYILIESYVYRFIKKLCRFSFWR